MVYFPKVKEAPARPTKCPGCERWYVPNPKKAHESCCVMHFPGSCCHFSDTEVPAPQEETPEDRRMRLEQAHSDDLTTGELYEDLINTLEDFVFALKERADG